MDRSASGTATASSNSRTGWRRHACATVPTSSAFGRPSSKSWACASATTRSATPGPAPEVPPGKTFRGVLAGIIRDRALANGHERFGALDDDHVLNMQQYNLFPNLTVLVFSDMLQVVRSRPGATHEDAYMDAFSFELPPRGASATRRKPFDVELDPTGQLPIGLVLNQDVANFERSQRGLRQPGLTHLTVSPTEECRVVNLHRNLEEYLGIPPEVGAHSRISSTAGTSMCRRLTFLHGQGVTKKRVGDRASRAVEAFPASTGSAVGS